MHRTLDGTFLTTVANHPCVRPWLGGGDEPLDLRDAIADPKNIALQGQTGGFFLHQLDPGYYEAHSVFLPKSREAPRLAVEGFRYLFIETDCLEVVTKVPANNTRAHGLARWVGFTETYRDVWDGGDCGFRSLTFERWKARSFAGSARPRADEAFRLMIAAGNVGKAIWTFNRWARFAGEPTCRLISQNPLLIEMAGMLLDRNLSPLEAPCH